MLKSPRREGAGCSADCIAMSPEIHIFTAFGVVGRR